MQSEEISSQRGKQLNFVNVIDEEQLQENKVQMLTIVEKECSQHKECVKEKNGTYLSQNEEKYVREMNKEELTTRVSHKDNDEKLPRVVKGEERHAEYRDKNYGEIHERCQVNYELLEYFPEEPVYEDEIVVCDREVSRDLIELETYDSLQTDYVLASIEEGKDECYIAVKELEYKLLLKSKVRVQKQQMNTEEGDLFRDIEDVSMVEEESSQQHEGECVKLKQKGDIMQTTEIEETKSEDF